MVDRSKLIQQIEETNDTVFLTIGFRYRNPTTLDRPLTTEQAVQFVKDSKYFMELEERDGRLCLQCYTANDML